MTYSKQTWADGPSGGTPLSAARLNHIEDGIAAGPTSDPAITGILYDGNGNPTSITTDGVTTTYTWNSDGTPNTQSCLGVSQTCTYSAGQLTGISGGSSDLVVTINSYDTNGYPTSVTTGGVTTTYTYNSDGTMHTQTRLGVTRTYAYSGGQLVSVT